MTKICTSCNKELSDTDFYIVSTYKDSEYRRKQCKSCVNLRAKERYSPLQRRNHLMKYNYKISLDEFNLVLNDQKNQCAICETVTPTGKNNQFHLDHNHSTKKNRGILCHRCNLMIGQAQDDPKILEAAIQYLNHWGIPSQP
jgi:hypothetical protein